MERLINIVFSENMLFVYGIVGFITLSSLFGCSIYIATKELYRNIVKGDYDN